MGLFDEVRCEVDLPDPGLENVLFQTKDFPDPYLDKYVITKGGRLCMEGKDLNFHGDLSFRHRNSETRESVRYVARFTDGQLVRIKREMDEQGSRP